jgi:signal transduction histidine kinase
MLSVEYRETKSLVENNQFLMRNTVFKTLTTNISDKLANYPLSSEDIDLNWNELPLNFMVNHKGDWIFPLRFSGQQGNSLSELWRYYELDEKSANSELLNLSPESKLRIRALIAVKLALTANDQPKLSQQIERYFSLVENVQLSELEEIISGLRFLQLEKDARWNNQLIKLLLFQGSNQVTPLSDYIFKYNNKLSKADLDHSISKVQLILEDANIDTGWFNQSVSELWKPNLALDIKSLRDYSIVDNQWISIRTSDSLLLFLPFSAESELKAVEKTLKSQGVLNSSDSLSIGKTWNSSLIGNVADLPLDIQRVEWEKQADQQNYFFTIKVILTLTFIISLFIVVSLISYRNKKKTEFIDLRENFINLVSHELKTPLASIRIMVETLQKRNNRNLSIKDYPDKVISEVDRLWLMVDNLLSLNQIKSGELELNIDKVNLNALVTRVYDKFNEHRSHELILKNDLPKDCFCSVDPLLFELVIINLFSNSIKYCNKPDVKISVEFNSERNSLILSDNACGIKQSNWTRVFDDFYRDTSTSSKQGTGVGLSLCKQIMKIHNGTIAIADSTENGTIWVIALPEFVKQDKGTNIDY